MSIESSKRVFHDNIKELERMEPEWNQRDIWNLYEQIAAGDRELFVDNGKLVCSLAVGFCRVSDGKDKEVWEEKQVWHKTGDVIYRDIPISGKLPGTMPWRDGMVKELHEELGLDESLDIDIKEHPEQQQQALSKTGDGYFTTIEHRFVNVYFSWTMPRKYIRKRYVERGDKKDTYFHWVPDKGDWAIDE